MAARSIEYRATGAGLADSAAAWLRTAAIVARGAQLSVDRIASRIIIPANAFLVYQYAMHANTVRVFA
jgi:hypothetical protein